MCNVCGKDTVFLTCVEEYNAEVRRAQVENREPVWDTHPNQYVKEHTEVGQTEDEGDETQSVTVVPNAEPDASNENPSGDQGTPDTPPPGENAPTE